jgi:hypothetical protein
MSQTDRLRDQSMQSPIAAEGHPPVKLGLAESRYSFLSPRDNYTGRQGQPCIYISLQALSQSQILKLDLGLGRKSVVNLENMIHGNDIARLNVLTVEVISSYDTLYTQPQTYTADTSAHRGTPCLAGGRDVPAAGSSD